MGPDSPPDTAEWHADCTFRSSPPFLSVLAALELPEVGGDTLFASAFAALASLPAPLRGHLEGLSAARDAGSFRNNLAAAATGGGDDDAELTAGLAEVGSAVHPAVGVRVRVAFPQCKRGAHEHDSDVLLAPLFAALRKPEVQCRVRWEAGTVVLWQNTGYQHYAYISNSGLSARFAPDAPRHRAVCDGRL